MRNIILLIIEILLTTCFCEKENIAYNKTTDYSSYYRDNSRGDRAVNGVVNDTDYFLSDYYRGSDLWWLVDLGHVSVTTELHLFTRQDNCTVSGRCTYNCADGLDGVDIYVTNRTNGRRDDTELCHTIPGSLKGYVPYKINLSLPRYGRYVLVLLKGGPYLYIVEFRVFECTDGSYGPTCTGVCNCRDDTEVYNKVDGSCNSGCSPGYYVSDCSRECQCNMTGSQSEECSNLNGQCSCKGNVDGLKCDKCKPRSYGFSAQGCKMCHCFDINSSTKCFKSSVRESPLFIPLIIVSCLMIIFLVRQIKPSSKQLPPATNANPSPLDVNEPNYFVLQEASEKDYEGQNTYEGPHYLVITQ